MTLPTGIYYSLPSNATPLYLSSQVFSIPTSPGSLLIFTAEGVEQFITASPDQEATKAIFTAAEITDLTCTCRHDLITAVRVSFAYDYAANEATRSILLEAVEPLRDYGRIESELRCLWLTSPRAALKVGTAWLSRKSRPIWEISFTVGLEYCHLAPGDWLEITHPYLPVSGMGICLEVAPDYDRAEVRITTEIMSGPVPNITLTTLAAAYDPQTLPGVTVQFSAGQVNLSFKDDAGKPLSGAVVLLDNTTRRITDSAGNATFTGVAHGEHLVTITAPGYPGIEQKITV